MSKALRPPEGPRGGGEEGGSGRPGACAAFAEAVPAYVYGELARPDQDELEAHLAVCAGCRAESEQVRALGRDLDLLEVPAPSAAAWAVMESRLETRVAPLRARRLASGEGLGWARVGWPLRVAAGLLVAALGGSAAWLGADNQRLADENERQRSHIAEITRDLGDMKFRGGDIRGAFKSYSWALSNGVTFSPEQMRRLRAQERLEALPDDLARAWSEAQREDVAEQRRRLAEILWHHPEHAFADEAFLMLCAQTPAAAAAAAAVAERPARLRPLEEVAQKPLAAVRPPLPGAEVEAHFRAEAKRLEESASELPSAVRPWALYRAARVLEEELQDAAGAAERYDQVARRAGAGPLRDLAVKRLAGLERRR